MSKITKFQFHGDELDVAHVDGGDVAIPLRRLCEVLGVDFSTQLAKLKKSAWATMVMITTVAEDGKNRETACLHRRSIPMWLAGINAEKIREEARPKLLLMQREMADVLADHFLGKRGAPQATVLEAASTLVQQGMRVSDDPVARRQLSVAIRRVMRATGRSWPSVEGFVRRVAGSPGWLRIAMANVPRVIANLEAIEEGHLLLPERNPPPGFGQRTIDFPPSRH